LRAQGDVEVAGRFVREGRAALEQLAKSGTPKRAITSALALAPRLEAQLSDAAGEPGAARSPRGRSRRRKPSSRWIGPTKII
jgi:hypothetical protein